MIHDATRSTRNYVALLLAAFAVVLLAGCGGGGGGGGGTTPGSKSSVVVGKLLPPKLATAQPAGALATAEGDITVTLLSDPSITTTVGSDGTFTLRGLPAGSITLVFTQGGTEIGRLTFDEVAANQQITINVEVVSGDLVLVDEDRRGIGDAGVELEGPVQNVITVSTTGDSRFVIQGREVVARPGVTAIRQGNTRKTVDDVTLGKQVHVKGTTVPDSTDVLAFEIILQNPTTGTAADGPMTICHIPPGKPSNAHTITISSSAWPAHQAHGDTEGACTP